MARIEIALVRATAGSRVITAAELEAGLPSGLYILPATESALVDGLEGDGNCGVTSFYINSVNQIQMVEPWSKNRPPKKRNRDSLGWGSFSAV